MSTKLSDHFAHILTWHKLTLQVMHVACQQNRTTEIEIQIYVKVLPA